MRKPSASTVPNVFTAGRPALGESTIALSSFCRTAA